MAARRRARTTCRSRRSAPPRGSPPISSSCIATPRAGAAMVPALTWIGHASTLVQLGGSNLLTDPIFSERASPLSFAGPKRHVPPGPRRAELPHIDAVLISHNHYDHLDLASVKALAAQAGGPPLFVVPLGLKAWFAGIGHRERRRAGLVARRSGRRGRDRLHARAALVGALARRSDGNALGRLRHVRARLPRLVRGRHRLLEGLRRHPRALRRAPRRRPRLRPGADPDRRLRAALVHARAARRPGRGGAASIATCSPSTRSASTGAPSSSPTSRSTSRRTRSPRGAGWRGWAKTRSRRHGRRRDTPLRAPRARPEPARARGAPARLRSRRRRGASRRRASRRARARPGRALPDRPCGWRC